MIECTIEGKMDFEIDLEVGNHDEGRNQVLKVRFGST